MCPTDESRGHLCSRFSPRECALAFRHCYRSSTLTFLQVDFLDGLSMCAHRIQTGTQTCEGRPVPTQRSPFLLAWSLWREPISLAALWQMDAFPLAYHHPFVFIFSRSRFLARRFQMARPWLISKKLVAKSERTGTSQVCAVSQQPRRHTFLGLNFWLKVFGPASLYLSCCHSWFVSHQSPLAHRTLCSWFPASNVNLFFLSHLGTDNTSNSALSFVICIYVCSSSST